jgi:hypothetical protein
MEIPWVVLPFFQLLSQVLPFSFCLPAGPLPKKTKTAGAFSSLMEIPWVVLPFFQLLSQVVPFSFCLPAGPLPGTI